MVYDETKNWECSRKLRVDYPDHDFPENAVLLVPNVVLA